MVKACLQSVPDDWSMWVEVFERHGIAGTVQTDEPPTLSGYIAPGDLPSIPALSEELIKFGAKSVEQTQVEEIDWAEAWKQYFKPRKVGENLVVCPTWEEYDPAPNEVVIWLDPGQAFGTGDHPTTRMCLLLIEKANVREKDIADIGCGSGILSVASGLLGCRSIVAVDTESECVESTLANLSRANLEASVHRGRGFDPLAAGITFDVVLSNIISAALISLAPQVQSRLRVGGKWIVSGIIHENWPDVLKRAEQCGFKLDEKLEEGDWVAAVLTL